MQPIHYGRRGAPSRIEDVHGLRGEMAVQNFVKDMSITYAVVLQPATRLSALRLRRVVALLPNGATHGLNDLQLHANLILLPRLELVQLHQRELIHALRDVGADDVERRTLKDKQQPGVLKQSISWKTSPRMSVRSLTHLI